jgi:hypothetical protein
LQERLDRLVAEDEARGVGSIQDAAYFEQHPTRRYRMRLATPGEIRAMEIVEGPQTPPGDAFWWVAIKQLHPRVHVHVHITAPLPPGPIADIPEHVVRKIFELRSTEPNR